MVHMRSAMAPRQALSELKELADYLDGCDAGLYPVRPDVYRAAALRSLHLLERFGEAKEVRILCSLSWALTDLAASAWQGSPKDNPWLSG